MNIKSPIFLLVLLVIACGTVRQPVEKKTLVLPGIVDLPADSIRPYHTSIMRVPVNDLEYLGNMSQEELRLSLDPYHDDLAYGLWSGNKIYKKSPLRLIVNTHQMVSMDLENETYFHRPTLSDTLAEYDYRQEMRRLEAEWKLRPRRHIMALPVFIINESSDTLSLGIQDGEVTAIQEARDEHGVWRPIEYWLFSWCGNSYSLVGLRPHDFALIKIKKYHGPFETEMRLKLKNGDHVFYSNTFKGSIDKNQFLLPEEARERYFGKKTAKKTREHIEHIFLNR